MKPIVTLAGVKEDDPRRQVMLDKKAEPQKFCAAYENIWKQPQFEWAVKKGVWPCRKVLYTDSEGLYVCGLPKEFPPDRWRDLAKSIGGFYRRWTDGCDILPQFDLSTLRRVIFS